MSKTRRPNLLFVFSDQHRWCDLGCYGNAQVHSPHFESFAGEAARMTRCFSNSPLCVPARGTLLTGLYPLRHRAVTNDLPIDTAVTSIADVLREAGYHTGYIGKWHLAGIPREQAIPPGRGRLGFEEWKVVNCGHKYLDDHYYDEAGRRIGYEGYEPEVQTGLALDFIGRAASGDRPWSLHLSWGPPHDPYQAVPGRFLDHYDAASLRLRDNVPESILTTLKNPRLTRDDVRRNLRGYYAHITALDEQFGRLLAHLEATGQADNTVVVYTSDHGDMLGSQGLCNKQLPFDESAQVPLLVRWPGKTRRGACDGLIGLVDLAPSLLGLAGLTFPGEVDGRDLHGLFVDPAARGRDAVYLFDLVPCHQAMDRGSREWRALRTARHTFVRSAEDEGHALFDNDADPFQLRNLIDDPAQEGVRAELRARLAEETSRHDALLGWREFIRHFGLLEEWNRSQRYFNREEMS